MNGENISNNKVIYQISLNSRSLGLVNPYLFIEKLRDEIYASFPNVKIRIIYHTKGKGQSLIQLKCFVSFQLSQSQADNIQEEISFIATNLQKELSHRIEEAKRSVA